MSLRDARILADRRRAFTRALALLLALAALVPVARAESSEPAPLAAKSLLLGIARAGGRLVAVGDRGHVLVSGDDGSTWTQVLVPTRAMLTSVSFPDARHGWAVGHDGVILATADGGTTWTRQDGGKDLETILLSVLFLDSRRGFAVGAYGKFLSTGDGGATWVAAKPSGGDAHFNAIAAGPDGELYLAGESGTLLLSRDGGREWSRSEVPYDGSLFGVLPLGNRELLTYGLRGHILDSSDDGATWVPHNSVRTSLIMTGVRLDDGTVVLAGQGGIFHVRHANDLNFAAWKPADFGGSIAALVAATDGAIVTVGEAGAVRITLP
jgi:photosystem II stability/assembly factor-like uncharacterized protein